jgi:uncharacterized protein
VLDWKAAFKQVAQFTPYSHLSSKETLHMPTSKRGFASMDPSKQREIASKGGRAAHAKGTAHEFTTDEARVAGRKGGEAVSRDRAHMSAIGREGGHSRGARARANATGSDTGINNSGINSGINNDVARNSDQTFERQVNTERSGFESTTRNERDREIRDNGPFATRDRI